MVSEPWQSKDSPIHDASYDPHTRSLGLDDKNPWPGLEAYDEASSAFFYGRKREAIELFRLVRLAPMTVLYGKSGLGKSSLLQAGLFPLLREQHYLPVYLHIDFSDGATNPPLEQVTYRLEEELARAGTEFPRRSNGESLWEYLHRDDMEIWSKDNFPLVPVLVFDQFEELFSRRVSDSKWAKDVRNSLADLIDNCIPTELANDTAESKRSRLNLLSQRYRIILSFREDYLPDIKSWEKDVPSLLRSYLRLEPMTRQCAIEAVEGPGRAVLEDGVAASIVDFVGRINEKGSEINRALIEPVLLCLCCYQLNRRRTSYENINKSLVESIGRDILNDFYQGALNDEDVRGPPDAADFIERYLIQGDRFRGNYPKAEAIDGKLLSQTQLDALTGRLRLLRVVQYADTARIELIHDRLIEVACKARDERKAMERQAEQKRQAAQATLKLKRRLWGAGSLIALILLVLIAVLSLYHNLWEETRPWATLDSMVTGRRYPLSQDVANIGRPAQGIRNLLRQVELVSQSISRIHLMIFRNFYAIDMRSLYGTTINGEFLPYGSQRQLAGGDVIVLAGTAVFLFHPLTYQAWQFLLFCNPPLSDEAPPKGWGLLIDSRRRFVFPLTQDEEFIATAGESGVEPREDREGAIAVVRRLDIHGRVPLSSESQTAELFERRPEDSVQREIILYALARPETADGFADLTGSWLTIEDVADGQALEADIKADDYSYGQFTVPEGKRFFSVYPRGGGRHGVDQLAFHQGERRFQVIMLDPDIESSPARGFQSCIDGLSSWLMKIVREVGYGVVVQALRERGAR